MLTKVTKTKMKPFLSMALSVMLVMPCVLGFAQTGPALLDAAGHPKFKHDLPRPERIDKTRGGSLSMGMYQKVQYLGLEDDLGNPLPTTVWAYGTSERTATYPGPTIIAKENKRLYVKWENYLPGHFLPVDYSLHLAHPHFMDPDPSDGEFTPEERVGLIRDWYENGNVPTVAHLHGGHTESASDGLPEAWFTQGFAERGDYFVKSTYKYDNDQEAGTLWYHDHALGITRLNVYAGLAGYYFLRDDHELSMTTDKRRAKELPHPDYEYEYVIQDRYFTPQGELFYPANPGDPAYADFITDEGAVLPPEIFPGGGPTALAEFFGDFILVNGVPWPKLNVEPRKYRFRMLNGSDSRFYVLGFDNPDARFLVVGTDVAFVEQPVALQQLLIAPGERYDIVIDFSQLDGETITVTNAGPDAPFGGFPVDPADIAFTSTRVVSQFIVDQPLSRIPDATVSTASTLNNIATLSMNNSPRQLVLFEGSDEFGRLQPFLGTLSAGSMTWVDPITENPALNAVETWEVYNATMDAHPVHLHLVAFQINNRQGYTFTELTEKDQIQHNGSVGTGYILNGASPSGAVRAPDAYEVGWKDTHIAYPGEVSRVTAKFDRPGRYVWHCHILSHEDHEMMRPFYVGSMPPSNNARIADSGVEIQQNSPNPFTSSTQIRFELTQSENVHLNVFDLNGRMVYQYAERFNAGKHALFWDGFDLEGQQLPRGVYVYRLSGESFEDTKRLMIER